MASSPEAANPDPDPAIHVMAAHFYVERQPVTFTTTVPHEIPMLARELISPFRVYR